MSGQQSSRYRRVQPSGQRSGARLLQQPCHRIEIGRRPTILHGRELPKPTSRYRPSATTTLPACHSGVDDARGMGRLQRSQDLHAEPVISSEASGPTLEPLLQRLTLRVLQDDETELADQVGGMNRRDIRVAQ